MRDRLAAERTHMLVSTQSTGSVLARRWVVDHWEEARVSLAFDAGDFSIATDASGALKLDTLTLRFEPIPVPDSVFGHAASLVEPRVQQMAAAAAGATWGGPNAASVTIATEVEISWRVESGGGGGQSFEAPLVFPLQMTLTGDGDHIDAKVAIHAPGTVWSLAELYELLDAQLALEASTAN